MNQVQIALALLARRVAAAAILVAAAPAMLRSADAAD